MNAHGVTAGVVAVWLALLAAPASAQEKPIEPDRPDFTNGAHLVPRHAVEVELGAAYVRDADGEHSSTAPVSARIGVSDWLEVEVGVDALVAAASSDTEATGGGAFQVGAKIRLWSAPDGESLFSILSAVDVPTAVDEHGTKSRDPDVTVRALWGFDVGSRGHLDVNYGIGSIRTTLSEPRFVQHVASGSFTAVVTPRLTPYVEVFGISREHADGTPVVALSAGATYLLRPRVAVDAGVLFGTTAAAPAFSAFGGLSFIVKGARPAATSASRVPGRD